MLTPLADFVFTNGRVYTVNSEQEWVEAAAVRRNEIIFVGDGGKRTRRFGIVALARKLLIALWRYVEYGPAVRGHHNCYLPEVA